MKYVIKRNGDKVPFDFEKIKIAVKKALKNDYKYTDLLNGHLSRKVSELFTEENNYTVNIEDIQNAVEEELMSWSEYGKSYSKAAKDFILYRDKHAVIRNFVNKKINYINKFAKSDNTANATIDDNSNVNTHNIANLNAEIHKEDNININLGLWENKLKELYPTFNYKQMREDFDSIAYPHDLNSQIGMPYCVAISMYPFLLNGIKDIGGLSVAPKNIDSFCGMFVNMVFAVAAQYKGAVATPGLLLCMDWYLRKEYGENYHINKNEIVIKTSSKEKSIHNQIHQYFQQICYSLMQPSAARGAQAVFWNLSIFDKPFYDTMYGDFYFPDGSKPNWESFNWLQKDFLHWFNQERLKCILTFPVVSLCLIYQDGKFVDESLYKFACQEYSEGNSFFTYINDSPESLSSCCRLSSKISKPQFNFTNGQLSEMTGSKNVITLNLNRIIQDWYRQLDVERLNDDKLVERKKSAVIRQWDSLQSDFSTYLRNILERLYKYQIAYNGVLMDLYNADMLPVYNAGFINMKKQYLTIGINGLNQAWEFLDGKCNKNDKYKDFCNLIFTTIKDENTKHKTNDLMFNTEFTP